MAGAVTVWVVETTVATREQAHDLARRMVAERLAACVHVEPIESVYRWKGGVSAEPEYRLAFKTTAERYPALETAVRAQHPYELPQIFATAAVAAEPGYAEWVRESVSAPDD